MDDALSYIHLFEKGAETDARPLLLLHGTGGDENDLVPLGRMIAPAAPLLSPRGNVLENGMPRFFRRLAEGVFDEDDVAAVRKNSRTLSKRREKLIAWGNAHRARLFKWREYGRGRVAHTPRRHLPVRSCYVQWCHYRKRRRSI